MKRTQNTLPVSKFFAGIFHVLQLVASALLIVVLVRFPILPAKYFIAVCVGCFIFLALDIYLLSIRRGKVSYTFGIIISLLITVLTFTGFAYLEKTRSTIKDITSEPAEKLELTEDMVIVVKVEDSATSVKDTLSYPYGIQKEIDYEKSLSAVEHINKENKCKISVLAFDYYSELANALLDGTVKAIIMNESYVEIVGEYEEDFEDKIRILEHIKFTPTTPVLSIIPTPTLTPEPEPTQAPDATPTPEPTPTITPNVAPIEMPHRNNNKDIANNYFTVYFSGIDVYGSIGKRSRSDVNIVMTVNPTTKNILLVSIPRDAYVTIPGVSGGKYDKLTHAGLYGVSASMKTLQNIYGIKLDYYVRVNFSSVEKFVDLLGGIDVYSPADFISKHTKTHYTKGVMHMDGPTALEFARERYAFHGGDAQRGKNQMEVIKSIIKKMSSPAMLTKFSDIMNAVSGNMQTDLSMDQLTSIVRMQLNDNASWNIETYSVKTKGGMEYCYSYHGKKLYVGFINWDSAAEAGRKMRAVMKGN